MAKAQAYKQLGETQAAKNLVDSCCAAKTVWAGTKRMGAKLLVLSPFVLSCALLLPTQSTAGALGARPTRQAFQTADGATLVGDVYVGRKDRPSLLMWHMLGKSRQAFAAQIPKLTSSGFAIINMDLRGHGQSTAIKNGTALNFQTFKDSDWLKLPQDEQTVVQDAKSIPGIDGTNLVLIGSSIGANAAAIAGNSSNVKALVLLSPGNDYHGLRPESALRALRKPVLILAANGDSQSADGVKSWKNLGSNVKVEIVDGSAHGNNLLDEKPQLLNDIMNFIDKSVNISQKEPTPQRLDKVPQQPSTR
jgi:pimeloyl-ACP methyl ester carboxylesterase